MKRIFLGNERTKYFVRDSILHMAGFLLYLFVNYKLKINLYEILHFI